MSWRSMFGWRKPKGGGYSASGDRSKTDPPKGRGGASSTIGVCRGGKPAIEVGPPAQLPSGSIRPKHELDWFDVAPPVPVDSDAPPTEVDGYREG